MKHQFSRKITVLLVAALALLLLALAGGSASADDDQWYARFWNNTYFGGEPVLERYDNAIDFDWGQGDPGGPVSDDNFSAKWKRRIYFEPGVYRFNATMDDGMRVYLDDQLIIDSWNDSQAHTVTKDISVSGGEHDVKVEYYEVGGEAIAKFSYQLIQGQGQPGTGGGQFYPNWKAEYFNNTTLSGTPILVRDDRYLNQNWGTGSPEPGIVNSDYFSARWTKTLSGSPSWYHIWMTSDDGSRLYINNQLLIDSWAVPPSTTKAADYYYPGGAVQVRVEYFDYTVNAYIQVNLSRQSGGAAPPTTLPAPLPPAGSCAPVQGYSAYVNTDSLNFRSGPGTRFPVVATLPKCTVVQLTGYRNSLDAAEPWVQAYLPDGRVAWANANYLVTGVPVEQLTVLSD